VVVAGGAGAAVYAATKANSNDSNAAGQGLGNGAPGQGGAGQNGTGQNAPGQNGTGQNGAGGFAGPGNTGVGAAGQAVHGEYVVQRNGQYVTELEQTGTVTAVSSSQITVKSADGYVQTYAISSDTTVASFAARGSRSQGSGSGSSSSSTPSLATGQTVRVTALKNGNAALSILITPTTSTSGQTN
ncbi:hypothetical protein, partial [Sinomonas sp. G460-2]|uniref:hypothetical protein n=1 Tax=Sinomonas sp. G460-2 TaxID=3393464 RepID=UPI0039EFDA8D